MVPPSRPCRGRWSGAPAHRPWDGRTRCPDAPPGAARAPAALPGDLSYPVDRADTTVPRAPARPAHCPRRRAAPSDASFDPTGACTADGSAPGAYPELEALVPTTYEGKGPDRLDSGRNCTPQNLATLQAAGIDEVRFAGGTWGFGGGAGGRAGRLHGRGPDRRRHGRVLRQSAKAASRTTVTGESEADASRTGPATGSTRRPASGSRPSSSGRPPTAGPRQRRHHQRPARSEDPVRRSTLRRTVTGAPVLESRP